MGVYQLGNSDLAIRAENRSDGQPEYIGESKPGIAEASSDWRIFKLTYDSDGNFIKKSWANSTNKFDKSWSSKDTYVYL